MSNVLVRAVATAARRDENPGSVAQRRSHLVVTAPAHRPRDAPRRGEDRQVARTSRLAVGSSGRLTAAELSGSIARTPRSRARSGQGRAVCRFISPRAKFSKTEALQGVSSGAKQLTSAAKGRIRASARVLFNLYKGAEAPSRATRLAESCTCRLAGISRPMVQATARRGCL